MGKSKKTGKAKVSPITKAGDKFTFAWKLPSNKFGKGTNFKLRLNKKWGKAKSIGNNKTTRKETIDHTKYFPYTKKHLTSVSCAVQGKADKKGYTMSSWAYPDKAWVIKKPNKPKITIDRTHTWTTAVEVSTKFDKTSHEWATRMDYQIGWVKREKKTKNGKVTYSWPKWTSEKFWKKYTLNKVNIREVKKFTINDAEESTKIENPNNAWYRVIRARIAGPAGYKGWTYKTFSYAAPYKPINLSLSVKEINNPNRTVCTFSFQYKHTRYMPTSSFKVKYAFAEPVGANLNPSEASWTDAAVGDDKRPKPEEFDSKYKTMQANFIINGHIPAQQLLYVRVIAYHNGKNTPSEIVKADLPGRRSALLDKPTISGVDAPIGNRVTVHLTNNSSVGTTVKLAIVYIDENSENGTVVGIIPTRATEYSQDYDETVEIPPDFGDFAIGAWAFVGSYESEDVYPEDDPEASPLYTRYFVTAKYRSSMATYGGDIPVPPTNVQAVKVEDANHVKVTWDWAWRKADSAEIAWSDFADAMTSTEEPSTHTVTNQNESSLVVKNLEEGKTWYFWVRLKKGNNYSIWSDPAYVTLSSSPNIPTLELSREVININETFTATWAYVSPDGKPQAGAKICLCDVDGDTITPNENNIIFETEGTSQYVVLDPKSESLNWSSGNEYYLAVIVMSSGGLMSEGWSNIESIRVADPIKAQISTTSLTLNIPGMSYPGYYDSSSTYSSGTYVLREIQDLNNNDPNRTKISLFKSVENILTPEEWDDDKWINDEDKTYLELPSLPFVINVVVDGNASTQSLKIERASDYFIPRPDNNTYGGYEKEVIYQTDEMTTVTNYYAVVSQPTEDDLVSGKYYEYDSLTESYIPSEDSELVPGKTYYYIYETNGSFSIDLDDEDLYGNIDDGALYNIVYRIDDEYGQYSEVVFPFLVRWDHQAVVPDADVWVEKVRLESGDKYISKIRINTPGEGYTPWTGDCCDIYRISANGIEMIYQDAQFGEVYVDPYPTLGEHGGHRIAYRTLYGDFITEDESLAILDFEADEDDSPDYVQSDSNLIDFDGETVNLVFNVSINNTWSKDFQKTKFLGGTTQGDWNVGTDMTSSISTSVLTTDWDTVSLLRDLAFYDGACRVRTRDGMNYYADVQVSEQTPYNSYFDPNSEITQLAQYTLNITRLDPVEYDGMTLKEWNEYISDEIIPVDPEEGE